MPGHSAGVLLYRRRDGIVQVLLAHPGGPYWRGRDAGAWTIPKGLLADGESAEAAARREVQEELGLQLHGPLVSLGWIRQRSGKRVDAFAAEAEFDVATLRSNAFRMEWPPRSGRMVEFPEVDRAAWFTPADARRAILPAQAELLGRLEAWLS